MKKAQAVGINHVALVVGDVDEALAFYGELFDFELRGRSEGAAFIDLGDQFIALMEPNDEDGTPPPREQHFGLVVTDKAQVVRAINAAGINLLDSDFVDFLDPWGNRIQIIEYSAIQFLKAPQVLARMGLENLKKSASARKELLDKGIAISHSAEQPPRGY